MVKKGQQGISETIGSASVWRGCLPNHQQSKSNGEWGVGTERSLGPEGAVRCRLKPKVKDDDTKNALCEAGKLDERNGTRSRICQQQGAGPARGVESGSRTRQVENRAALASLIVNSGRNEELGSSRLPFVVLAFSDIIGKLEGRRGRGVGPILPRLPPAFLSLFMSLCRQAKIQVIQVECSVFITLEALLGRWQPFTVYR